MSAPTPKLNSPSIAATRGPRSRDRKGAVARACHNISVGRQPLAPARGSGALAVSHE